MKKFLLALVLLATPASAQNFLGMLPTDSLVGRDTAATGQAESITLGTGLEFTGSKTIQRSALSGDVSASAGSNTTTIGADKVLESMLKVVDTPSDEECLTYESTVGDFEWQSCASGGLPADPGANSVLGWDDTANQAEWWNPGNGLTASTTTIDCDAASDTAIGCVELTTDTEVKTGTDTTRAVLASQLQYANHEFCFKVGDETTAITTGTAKVTFYFPYAFTVTGVYAGLTTQSSSGLPTFDINEAGTTIISTKLTIDANEDTSGTAATAAVISDSSIAANAKMTVDIDTAGTGATGPEICILGNKS